jgi:hypothetical protein
VSFSISHSLKTGMIGNILMILMASNLRYPEFVFFFLVTGYVVSVPHKLCASINVYLGISGIRLNSSRSARPKS